MDAKEIQKKVGEGLCAQRELRGLSREELLDRISNMQPDSDKDPLSLSTLKRIEKGETIDIAKASIIAEALNIDEDILNSDIRATKDVFRDMACKDINEKELDQWFQEEYDLIKINFTSCYPSISEKWQCKSYHIKNLFQFIIYFPLLLKDPISLLASFMGIWGDVFLHEDYILDKFENIYNHLPNDSSKKYADKMAELCSGGKLSEQLSKWHEYSKQDLYKENIERESYIKQSTYNIQHAIEILRFIHIYINEDNI